MVWPWPIEIDLSAYAMEQDCSGMNRWRFVRPGLKNKTLLSHSTGVETGVGRTVSIMGRRVRGRIVRPVRPPPARRLYQQECRHNIGGADEDYCCPGRNVTGTRACALASLGGSADTGLRAGVAIGGGGVADVLRRRFCSEALAIARAICSWLALSCSAVLAFSRTISSWLVLSCSIPCCTFARSRAIVWSNCVSSGGIGATAASCGAG